MDKSKKFNTEEQIEIIAQAVVRIEARVEAIDTGVETLHNEMNERFEKVDERFERIDDRLDNIDERLASIEMMTGSNYKDIGDLQNRTLVLETRVDKLEIVPG